MLISVIVPCFNEADVIEKTISKLSEVMTDIERARQLSYELVFVDDGSRDATLDKLKAAALTDKRIKYVSCLLYTSPSPRDRG